MNELRLTVPMVPPSGNHYKKFRVMPTANGKHVPSWYHTADAKVWWEEVALIAAGRRITGTSLEVQYIVYLPTRRKADVDNFAKCIFDALTRASVIDDDSLVDDFHGHRRYDPLRPRTVIVVKSNQEQMF
jgi:crossover junction endodeoxyribonuclease RusA